MPININKIAVSLLVIGLFVALYFVGNNFIKVISPDLQVSNSKVVNNKIDKGSSIPYFDLLSANGSKINNQDVNGEPVVLTFWSTWNAESVDQLMIIDNYLSSKTEHSATVRIIAIDSQESKENVLNVLRRGGYKVEVLMDENGDVTNSFNVKTLPTTFFIDKEGKIAEIYIGTLSLDELVDKIENIIK